MTFYVSIHLKHETISFAILEMYQYNSGIAQQSENFHFAQDNTRIVPIVLSYFKTIYTIISSDSIVIIQNSLVSCEKFLHVFSVNNGILEQKEITSGTLTSVPNRGQKGSNAHQLNIGSKSELS